jgi:hypothetical protein
VRVKAKVERNRLRLRLRLSNKLKTFDMVDMRLHGGKPKRQEGVKLKIRYYP